MSLTEEIYYAPINDSTIPMRVWIGRACNGARIDAYILAVVPESEDDFKKFQEVVPPFMRRANKLFKVRMPSPHCPHCKHEHPIIDGGYRSGNMICENQHCKMEFYVARNESITYGTYRVSP